MRLTIFARLLRDERGATAIEYAFLASLIAAALMATILSLGNEVSDHYDGVGTSYRDAANAG